MQNKREKPFELYIHIPFCVKKCDYCDFLSGPAGEKEQQAYVRALLEEIAAVKEGVGRSVTSVFIGGGTPSVLSTDLIEEIMEGVNRKFSLLPDAEISMEVNPGTVVKRGEVCGKHLSGHMISVDKLRAYRKCGINRLSIGLQSADDRELRSLGRIHTYEQFLETYQAAREAGFDNVNVDLMSAIPGQTYEGWIRNLRTVGKLNPEHISAYSLIVEEGTPFAGRNLALPDEETEYRMYEDTAAVLDEYGYEQYEISNYAKAGRHCRHNEGYWQRRDYLGLGLGAASLWGNRRFSNTRDMKEYLADSCRPEKIRCMEPPLTVRDEMAEFMFLGLRMTKGVSCREFLEDFGYSVHEIYGDVLEKYTALSLLECKDDRISLTRKGIHVSNAVMAEFL